LPTNIAVELKTSQLELCIIIGNLFDNAVEACLSLPEDRRLIRIYMEMKQTQLYMSFTNTAGKGKLRKVGGRFLTAKGDGHGFQPDRRKHRLSFGFARLVQVLPELTKAVIQIGISAAFAFMLFAVRVPPGSPYAWLDSPWAKAGTVLAVIFMFILAPYLSILGGNNWTKAANINNKRNRFHRFYFYQMIDGSGTSKDIRIYRQKRIIRRQLDGYDETAAKRLSLSCYAACMIRMRGRSC
jgi:hypothetical protein